MTANRLSTSLESTLSSSKGRWLIAIAVVMQICLGAAFGWSVSVRGAVDRRPRRADEVHDPRRRLPGAAVVHRRFLRRQVHGRHLQLDSARVGRRPRPMAPHDTLALDTRRPA